MKEKIKKLLPFVLCVAVMIPMAAFADGAVDTTVSTAITGAAAGFKTEAGKVISAALGLGIIVWGAKRLWSTFKGMAK